MRKLIRYSVAAFLTWAFVTFAWASLSHVTGFVGPAQASEASLHWVADAITLFDPPGALGAPQRFAAGQIQGAAHTARDVHGVPERIAVDFVDWLGHDARHRGRQHRHRHEIRLGGGANVLVLPFDQMDGASERARERAIIELQLHRERTARTQERAERIRERARRHAERTRERALRSVERALGGAQTLEFRIDGGLAELDELGLEWERTGSGESMRLFEYELAEAVGSIEAEIEALAEELVQSGSGDRKDDLKRKIDEKIREIIERLRRELEDADFDIGAALDDVGVDSDSPVRIRIRDR